MFELIYLAIIQGLTEFLPISSSGHLNLLSYFMNLNTEHLLFFFLVLHAGTSFAAIYFFRKDILTILIGLKDIMSKKSSKMADDTKQWIILITCISIPTGIIGCLFKSSIEVWGQNLLFLGIAWIFTAIILWNTKKYSQGEENLSDFSYKKAFIVGLAQSLAIIPGISRSGITIAIAMFLGASSQFAGRLSFLASFVPIFGGLLLEIIDINKQQINIESSISALIIGFIVSFFVGLVALKFLMKLLTHGKLYVFSIYCLMLGIFVSLFHVVKL